ncbi:HAMP domain-containing histidine kinase, partial [bacterium]|nr:HAMP domain-containing histidine kinase [bacterium]
PAGAVAGTEPLGDVYALTLLLVYSALFSFSAYLLLAVTRSLRRVQERILLAHEELERLSEQRKSFLYIAVHNLKAPVGAVTMLLDNMRAGLAGETTETQRDWIDRCRKRLDELSRFMADLQTLSSLETDIIDSVFHPVDVPSIARSLVDEYRDVAASHGQALGTDIRGVVPRVLGHDRLLREALVNYVTNAIKYSPRNGHITVGVRSEPPVVRVEVKDDGPGIPPGENDRLFREFARLPPRDGEAPTEPGTGLGLAIVRRIVAAHGGRVGVESEPGAGSTFFLELPALRD